MLLPIAKIASQRKGLSLCFLTILDEYTRECLAFEVARNLTSEDVLDRLTELFSSRGIPA